MNTEHSPGYDAFMLRLFLHAQYNANIAPLINEITKTANATPDIQVVAQPLTAGSVLFCERLKIPKLNVCLYGLTLNNSQNLLWWSRDKRRIHVQCSWFAIRSKTACCLCCNLSIVSATWIQTVDNHRLSGCI